MEINKAQAINGFIKFVKNDVIKKIPDQGLKMSLSFLVNLIELDHSIADKYLEKIVNENGLINIGFMETALCNAMEEYEFLPITIPGIPFISPDVKTLKFYKEDVKKLKNYMEV